ncbi:MFS transporter [Dictyobacter kobayashii]|uniref:MFS transporter n=1 Tax=Dictyobacter kobayashii TaxID=2014872 RepID=A0A402ANX3_9CHLR|nr:MFS transporter [Dictyobacter kobayashii]GCE20863.1 MFS transporter [Dictyobacter kobayashii]
MAKTRKQLLQLLQQKPDKRSDSFDRKLITPMIVGSVLNPVNSSIIAVSLVPIGTAFGVGLSSTTWLVSGLYLATALGQPVIGKLVDVYGPRRLYLAGAIFTGIAGLLGALAPSFWVLIVARVILGFGTCVGYPSAMYLIRSEARRTGHESPAGVLTTLAVSAQTIAVIGPPLGGVLISLGGWRTTFALNILLALACLYYGFRRLPSTTPLREVPIDNSESHLDYPGMLLFAVMLVSFLYFLMNPQISQLLLLVITVLSAIGFGWRELHCAAPFLDLRVFGGNRPLLITYIRNALAMTVGYAFLYGFSQWLQDGRGLNAAATGVILLPLSLVAIGVSSITGRRKEIRIKLLAAAIAQIIFCLLLLVLSSASPLWLLVVVIAIAGIPQGLASLANQNAVYYQADPTRMGASAGLLRTFTYLGALLASAANSLFLQRTADTAGLHRLAVFMLLISALFALLTVVDRSLGKVGVPNPDPTEKHVETVEQQ